uniref:Uncharacterized protein n=1 Tax=Steinernema glaseri TaxID=37863 RepID=A0A1I7YUL2_9BILA
MDTVGKQTDERCQDNPQLANPRVFNLLEVLVASPSTAAKCRLRSSSGTDTDTVDGKQYQILYLFAKDRYPMMYAVKRSLFSVCLALFAPMLTRNLEPHPYRTLERLLRDILIIFFGHLGSLKCRVIKALSITGIQTAGGHSIDIGSVKTN